MNFLSDKQYGFWPKSNILSAITDIVTRLKIGIDRKQLGLGIFIYQKKAFDMISHDLLIEKLNRNGRTHSALKISCVILKIADN